MSDLDPKALEAAAEALDGSIAAAVETGRFLSARDSAEIVLQIYLTALPSAVAPEGIKHHLRWLTTYAELMDETNWRDMKLKIERQVKELAADLVAAPKPPAEER